MTAPPCNALQTGRGAPSRTPTSSARSSEITPVELVVRPQYEDVFRKQNRRLLVRVKPLGE